MPGATFITVGEPHFRCRSPVGVHFTVFFLHLIYYPDYRHVLEIYYCLMFLPSINDHFTKSIGNLKFLAVPYICCTIFAYFTV